MKGALLQRGMRRAATGICLSVVTVGTATSHSCAAAAGSSGCGSAAKNASSVAATSCGPADGGTGSPRSRAARTALPSDQNAQRELFVTDMRTPFMVVEWGPTFPVLHAKQDNCVSCCWSITLVLTELVQPERRQHGAPIS
jgi:hypothetical protein